MSRGASSRLLLMAHRSGHAEIWRDPMTGRTSHKIVTFARPFSLSGIDEVQPAGSYTVETNEELLPGLSFPAYRRVATLIFLPPRSGVFVERVVNIDPMELEAVQKRDASIA
jgi:ribulose 1,5-bisphosphate carboxylase large subunit-like protein